MYAVNSAYEMHNKGCYKSKPALFLINVFQNQFADILDLDCSLLYSLVTFFNQRVTIHYWLSHNDIIILPLQLKAEGLW